MKTRRWLWFPLTLLLSLQAHAGQTIWRCGPDGRAFSDRPCSGGQTLPALRMPTAEDVREAERVAGRERKLADTLRAERHERARIAPGSGLIAIGPNDSQRPIGLRPLRKPHHLHKPESQRARGSDKQPAKSPREARLPPPRPGKGLPGTPRNDGAGPPDRVKRP